jgi:hypothetical protein
MRQLGTGCRQFAWLEAGFVKMALPRLPPDLTTVLARQVLRRQHAGLKNKSNFMKWYSLKQIPSDCKVIGELSELR